MQAKTTKKIVLRLVCNVCKAAHMHALKVRASAYINKDSTEMLSINMHDVTGTVCAEVQALRDWW